MCIIMDNSSLANLYGTNNNVNSIFSTDDGIVIVESNGQFLKQESPIDVRPSERETISSRGRFSKDEYSILYVAVLWIIIFFNFLHKLKHMYPRDVRGDEIVTSSRFEHESKDP